MISVVIPVFNNEDALAELNQKIFEALSDEDFEVIYVNDGSLDQSQKILESFAQSDQKVKVIQLSKNYGQHPAIGAGFEHAKGEIIVLMDADLQDRTSDLKMLVEEVRGGVDICFTRKSEVRPQFFLNLCSKLFHGLVDGLMKSNVPWDIGTYRAFNRKVLQAINSYPERGILYGPLMHHMGFTRKYVVVGRDPRFSGKSSYTLIKRIGLAVENLISYTNIPHKLFIGFGLILFITSSFYGLLTLVGYYFFDVRLMSGLTLVVMLLILLTSTIMVGLGIIGTYLFRVHQEVLQRPRYLIQQKINMN
mgnify:CR=1 FL=1